MYKLVAFFLVFIAGCLFGETNFNTSAFGVTPWFFKINDVNTFPTSASRYGNVDLKVDESPEETVGEISSNSNDWREPSAKSEERYVDAIRRWLNSLEPLQQERARKILREAHPGLHKLRVAIREIKAKLTSLSFDKNTEPESLPRLGQELQQLRKTMRAELKRVEDRLRFEVGIQMEPMGGESFWLSPPSNESDSDIENEIGSPSVKSKATP